MTSMSGGGGGGGGTPVVALSQTIGSYTTGTQSGSNAMAMTDGTNTLSIVIPAATHTRTAVLSGTAAFTGSANHSEFAYMLDGGSSPLVTSVSFADRNGSANADGNKVLHCSGIPISIPGDGSTHQVAFYTTAQGTTTSSAIGYGSISIILVG